jgi:ubiquitin-like protein Pup
VTKAERQQKKPTRKAPPPEGGDQAAPQTSKKGERLKEDMDRLLDEIDSVLEENAEEFIKNYVQKGGQ